MVETQVYEREKVSSTMINFLSHVIEFKNNESGAHILHVRNNHQYAASSAGEADRQIFSLRVGYSSDFDIVGAA